MTSEAEALTDRVRCLEERLLAQEREHGVELQKLDGELQELRRLVADVEERSLGGFCPVSGADHFTRKVEWTIPDFASKERELQKGESIWSPKFRAAGMDGIQLEFFPKGREKTTYEGFCSLFLWCPSGARIRYQLKVGDFARSPDEDLYDGRIGHGHSNFCPVAPQVDRAGDCIRLGVEFLDMARSSDTAKEGLALISKSLESMVAREAEVIQNRGINRVDWRIRGISDKLRQFPRGASIWSPLFSAGGIREILLEFYPNGSSNTTKDGNCAFYLRCPEGVSMIVTLFVGRVRKGPIKTTFDSLTGKGLPDFCGVEDEINWDDDSLDVGIEVQSQPSKTLLLES